ncbi:MAG: RDD family protein [Rudaea sp.]
MNANTPEMVLPNAYRATALHAGFWYRAAAYLIDMIILLVVSYALAIVVISTLHLPINRVVLILLSCSLVWWYFALFESSELQASPGKRVFGLRVVGEHGGRISFLRASVRAWVILLLPNIAVELVYLAGNGFFVNLVNLIAFIVWAAMPAFTRRKQGLHDWIANTFVVLEPGLQAFCDDDKQGLQHARPKLPLWVAVVPVVAICIGLPAWGGYRLFHNIQVRNQAQQAAFFADNAKTPIAEYANNQNAPAPNNAAVGLPAPSAIHGRYVSSVEVKNGTIIVTLGGQAASELQGRHLLFQHTPEPRLYGMLRWHCSSNDIARNVLPPGCL